MTRRPNILLIVSDDHGYADRSAEGTPGVRTPVLDRLAAEGATCTDAYVTAPICSPSRAGLITGQYQQRWGGLWFDSAHIGSAPTIAERLRDAGYATGYFGKVHYGDETAADRGAPPHHGFDESFYGLAGQSMGRLHYLHHSADAVAEYGEAAEAMGVQPFWSGEEPVEFNGFTTDEIAERAEAFIERQDGEQPFFAMVAFNAVHNFCWQLPDDELAARGLQSPGDWHPGASEYLDWYDGAISPNLPDGRAFYLAQLELMDRAIGRLLDRLDASGIADDTIVVYLTDNGGSQCNYGDNGALRGTKYTLWEGGIRVPFLVRWPGVAAARTVVSEPVSALDLTATFAAAAGLAENADDDGRDLRPLLEGDVDDDTPGAQDRRENRATGERELHWDCGWQWAVRRGDWKLLSVAGDSPTAQYVRAVEHTSTGDGLILTDLVGDPGERDNLAARRPRLVAQLTRAHERWREQVGLPAAVTADD
ncbi:sulfatase family protein [Microbacterium sp. nov. GSS16]|uniref:sulfatase family protein n=1 Tax=Microbacterium sp. nov. GSS16 TaxID=3019890 RepID=UPI0023066BDB|nr:sulfatase-like hydrolase/transferase [Microbacterium sp. nov. GSS16]WCD93685.1 sulfatase-like hydrolase/transferase [Microbacterium sp. nov. GSS16]